METGAGSQGHISAGRAAGQSGHNFSASLQRGFAADVSGQWGSCLLVLRLVVLGWACVRVCVGVQGVQWALGK